MDDLRKLCLPDATGLHTYELTETAAACTGPAQVQTREVPVVRMESKHGLPSLIKKLSSTDIYIQRKSFVFSNGVLLGIPTTLEVGPCAWQ